MDNKKDQHAKNILYLLSFLDTADRLNILLLEVRHLQQSIIDSLHAPTLYLPLRHEEKFIFGGWEKSKKKTLIEKTEQAILRYPTPKKAVAHWVKCNKDDQSCDGNNIEKRLLSRIGEIWTSDMWVRGERQHYHSLRALQILKQQIFYDKVILFKEAKYSNLLELEKKYKVGLKKPEFLILRRGIHFRIERYITSLRTQQQNFGKSLDFGLQRYPRPSVDRRREIGIFNDFLSNRSIDLQADTLHLLGKLTKVKLKNGEKIANFVQLNKATDTREADLYRESSMILHGWSPLMNVRNKQLWDNVRRDYQDIKGNNAIASETQNISYLDTSFWSPDRPDLQPLVSKEIAYSALRSLSNGFSDDYFANEDNELTKLWTLLSKEITHSTHDVIGLKIIHENSEILLRDMVSDCLAVSLKGISYLYALYLSSIGFGLENLLRLNENSEIKLESIEELSRGIASYETYYVWYFRLRFTAFWLRSISDTKGLATSKLDQLIFDGINGVCEDLIVYLDHHNVSEVRKPMGNRWKDIYENLEESIKKTDILDIVKKWKQDRREDTWNEIKKRSGKKNYHRSTIPLDARLQHFMFMETIKHKIKPHKALSNLSMTDKDLSRSLCSAYGISFDSINTPYTNQNQEHSKQLYRHLHDIPFQCSIMQSIDLLGRIDGEHHLRPNWNEFIDQIHSDMSLGREFFSFALEFYTWNRESPKSRLLLSINMLTFLQPNLDQVKNQKLTYLFEEIEKWLQPLKKDSIDTIKKYSHKKICQKYIKRNSKVQTKTTTTDDLKKIGAIQLDDAFCGNDLVAATKRRLEQLAGYKLKQLLEILKIYITPFIDNAEDRRKLIQQCQTTVERKIVENFLLMSNLIEFLNIRDDQRCRGNAENEFFHLLLHACGTQKKGDQNASDLNESHYPEAIVPVVITRLAISSSYTTANPKKINNKQNKQNMLGLADILTRDRWLYPVSQQTDQQGKQKTNYNHYSVVLGRYDVVSFIHTNLPCLCRVSHFPNKDKGIQTKYIDNLEKQNAEEAFVTHFPRREIAFSLKLYGDCDFNDKDYKLYAISSISLQRRSMRLNLLYRLLNARYLEEKQEQGKKRSFLESGVESHLNRLIAAFEEINAQKNFLAIKVLLTDGWGDLLLVFMYKDKDEGRDIRFGSLYNDLLLLQQALYEDFMVDRTELIYTPQCLDHMNFLDSYRFSFLFRFQEDRQLERSILNFIEALELKINGLPPWINQGEGNFDIVFTPGQYDIRINFHIDTQSGKVEDIYNELLRWLAEPTIEDETGQKYKIYNQWYSDGLSCIDKVETVIENIRYNLNPKHKKPT